MRVWGHGRTYSSRSCGLVHTHMLRVHAWAQKDGTPISNLSMAGLIISQIFGCNEYRRQSTVNIIRKIFGIWATDDQPSDMLKPEQHFHRSHTESYRGFSRRVLYFCAHCFECITLIEWLRFWNWIKNIKLMFHLHHWQLVQFCHATNWFVKFCHSSTDVIARRSTIVRSTQIATDMSKYSALTYRACWKRVVYVWMSFRTNFVKWYDCKGLQLVIVSQCIFIDLTSGIELESK